MAELIQLYASAPPDVAERLRIGSMLLQYGATSESAQIFQDLLHRAPQNADVHRGMAEVDFAQRDYVAARHEFQRAIRLNAADTASREGLVQTNAVIDMNGSLPGISSAERVRRSENLLNRVIADLEKCAGERIADRAADFDAARQLLSGKNSVPNDDRTLELQTMAQKLWSLRQPLCGNVAAPDKPVDLILAGLANE